MTPISSKRIAVFPGTFDPFTLGHMSIVSRGLELLDEVVIAIGINDSKRTYFTVEQRLEMLRDLFRDNPRIRVVSYDSLTIDLAKQWNARFILRGIRSVNDFEYEKTIADVNRKLSGVETIILFTEPELTHISSTIVRELLRFGHSVDELTELVGRNLTQSFESCHFGVCSALLDSGEPFLVCIAIMCFFFIPHAKQRSL